ncbi:hypothetical protein G6O67_007667 [Ophiocordyceps sinensis]|uniref:Uncharacterized protein n=2 Tax=Ophiocordyceps sinensis TaxID=72228 RepID=A0A8H4PLZ8_9HYPO|nr:hypothetical protein OCS_00795 [Ophiocordyceps sinensis CO18]KAF4505751.1 hypothetical protein G6O67_007667 [Ophiocordyceps sinensis]
MDKDMRVRKAPQEYGHAALGSSGRARSTSRDNKTEGRYASISARPGPLHEPQSDSEESCADRETSFGGNASGNDGRQSSHVRCPSQPLLGPCWTDVLLFEPDSSGSSRWSRKAASGPPEDGATIATGPSDEGTQAPQSTTPSSMARPLDDQYVLRELGSWGTGCPMPDAGSPSGMMDEDHGVLRELGSWSTGMPDAGSPSEMMDEIERWPSAVHSGRGSPLTRMPTPELSPLPANFEFLPCGNHHEEGLSNAWHMTPKAKGRARIAWAKAYIEQAKARAPE